MPPNCMPDMQLQLETTCGFCDLMLRCNLKIAPAGNDRRARQTLTIAVRSVALQGCGRSAVLDAPDGVHVQVVRMSRPPQEDVAILKHRRTWQFSNRCSQDL